jgi:hypothetical protein
MPLNVSGSVGAADSLGSPATNDPTDVCVVQGLLNNVAPASGGASPELPIDGSAGPLTNQAILHFQTVQFPGIDQEFLRDGRVDPGGQTLGALNALTSPLCVRLHVKTLFNPRLSVADHLSAARRAFAQAAMGVHLLSTEQLLLPELENPIVNVERVPGEPLTLDESALLSHQNNVGATDWGTHLMTGCSTEFLLPIIPILEPSERNTLRSSPFALPC